MPPTDEPPAATTPIAHVSYTTTTVGAAGDGPWWRRRPSPTTVAIGAAASLALAILLGLLLSPSMRRAPDDAVAARPAGAAATPASAVQTFTFEKAADRYQPPSAAEVERARAATEQAFKAGGVSELARAGLACFRSLEAQPSYRLMDYCLAFDLYGAAMNAQLAGGDATSSSSWFGSMGARHLNVAQSVMGADGDADARLLDLRRMTGQGAGVSTAALNPPASRAALQVETVGPAAGPEPLPLPALQPRGPAVPRPAVVQPAVVSEPEPVARPVAVSEPVQPAQAPAAAQAPAPQIPEPEPLAIASPPPG